MKKLFTLMLVAVMLLSFASVASAASWNSTVCTSNFKTDDSLAAPSSAGVRMTINITRNTNTTTNTPATTRFEGCDPNKAVLSSAFIIDGLGYAYPYFASKPTTRVHVKVSNNNGSGGSPSGNTSSAGSFNW